MDDLTATLEKLVSLLHDSQLVKKEKKSKENQAVLPNRAKEPSDKDKKTEAKTQKNGGNVTDMDCDPTSVKYLPLTQRSLERRSLFEDAREGVARGRRSRRSYVERYSPY